jgi:hypothetical protein
VKLSGMFGGYGQSKGVTANVFSAIETYVQDTQHRDCFLDDLGSWDEGDVRRLVSAFLGVRFPVLLALNKKDLPTSLKHIADIQAALPVHGAHVGIPLSANSEMQFMRYNIKRELGLSSDVVANGIGSQAPVGVWKCLQIGISLANPVIVFPVCDFVTLDPLPGLARHAAEDPSLPSLGMIACLSSAGGSSPSHWKTNLKVYTTTPVATTPLALRDAVVMKPCSTVEDLFLTLKRLGACGGEFVRAEGMRDIGQNPKPVPKSQILSKDIRIVRIMTNKRSAWQK